MELELLFKPGRTNSSLSTQPYLLLPKLDMLLLGSKIEHDPQPFFTTLPLPLFGCSAVQPYRIPRSRCDHTTKHRMHHKH